MLIKNWRSIERQFFISRYPSILLHNHLVGGTAPKDFGRVHLFGLGRRDDKLTKRSGAGDIRIVVDAIPKQRGKGLGPFVAQVLVIIPGAPPPPAILTVIGILWHCKRMSRAICCRGMGRGDIKSSQIIDRLKSPRHVTALLNVPISPALLRVGLGLLDSPAKQRVGKADPQLM